MNKILDKIWLGLCVVSFFWVLLFMILGPLIIALSYNGYYSYLGLTYFFYLPLIVEFYPEEKK